MAKTKTKTKIVPIDSLLADQGNVRMHPERNTEAVAASLKRFGAARSIVIDGESITRAGNATLAAAKAAGIKKALVVEADGKQLVVVRRSGWTETEAAAYAVADNRAAELADWDVPALGATLKRMRANGEDLAAVGYTEDELAALVAGQGGGGGNTDPDDVPAPQAAVVSVTGDLWEMGAHRLLCGDSTNGEDVGRVMAGEKAEACLTDPPYSVNYDRSQEERGGDKAAHAPYREAGTDPTSILLFMATVPSDVMIWTYPIDRHFQKLAEAYRAHKWELRRELVWVKNTFSFWPSANYQQKHEPIMLAVRKGKPVGGQVPANATTVLEYDKPHRHEDHPTARPAALWGDLLSNHVEAGDIVYDAFSGSGTTIIAAEQLNRRCYAIEIEPKYIDVAVRRWQAFTSKSATLEGDGRAFAEIESERLQ